jgi:hypothetical protein
MYFVHRPGRIADIPPCLKLLANSPFAPPLDEEKYQKYEKKLEHLLKTLPQKEEMAFAVVEDKDNLDKGIAGFAVSMYITPEFEEVICAKQHGPYLWTELVERADSVKNSPILTRRQIAKANAGEGLIGFSPFHIYNPEHLGGIWDEKLKAETLVYYHCITEAFLAMHKGNNHKAFYKEIYHDKQLDFNKNNGYELKRILDASKGLFFIEVDREQFVNGVGSLIFDIFIHKKPTIFFTNRQREHLRLSVSDKPRIKVSAGNMGITIDAINDLRQGIIKLAQKARGKEETFDEILNYVKANPEELRPYSRR